MELRGKNIACTSICEVTAQGLIATFLGRNIFGGSIKEVESR